MKNFNEIITASWIRRSAIFGVIFVIIINLIGDGCAGPVLPAPLAAPMGMNGEMSIANISRHNEGDTFLAKGRFSLKLKL